MFGCRFSCQAFCDIVWDIRWLLRNPEISMAPIEDFAVNIGPEFGE